MNNNPLINATGLKRYFDISGPFTFLKKRIVKAVDGVDIKIYNGEAFGLVGESGSGKSTLGRLLLRLIPASQGKIVFLNKDITDLPERRLKELRKQMQIILQNPYASLNPRMRVGKSAAEGLDAHRIGSKRERLDSVIKMFETVGLKREYIQKFPHELSGGERQRVCIARALILNPRFVVADEPVSALDVTIQAQILSLLTQLQKQFSLSILLITHDLRIVRHIAKTTAVMYLGKIVELADTEELFKNPIHPYSKLLLASIPPAHPKDRKNRTHDPENYNAIMFPQNGCRFINRCESAKTECSEEKEILREISKNHWVACSLNYK
ncbi:MAG TPA: ABC transporter ATP-binding protein [bacterium]